MCRQMRLFVIVSTLICLLEVQAASKYYSGENRPYEFGFTNEGQQHRHEKKDENGLIMGEFGFLTADGVYHVTVYATDENGGFKILSMKNIRTMPYPTAQVKKGHSLPFPPSKETAPQGVPQPNVPGPASPAKSCSHCSIPTTPPPRPQLTDIANVVGDPNYNNIQGPQSNSPNYPESPQYPGQEQQPPFGNAGERNPKQFEPQQPFESQPPFNGQQPFNPQQPIYPQQSFNPQQQPGPQKPTLLNAQMQIVDKNTDIHQLGPNEKPGLPNGITKDDMMLLLYTFNYTVGFHGHFEEGYTNGAKQGYYYITGRNGVRTRVDYVADEKGFRPKISQEVLDLLSDDVPKPETEKDEKYGLKGYEFKWLYYPVDSKSR